MEGQRYILDGNRPGYAFNDFYLFGNEECLNDAIRKLVADEQRFKFITYPPLKGNERHDLGGVLGTIHRGASLFIEY